MKELQGINAAARTGIELGRTESEIDAEIEGFVDAVVIYVAELGDGHELPEAYLGLTEYQLDRVFALDARAHRLRQELASTAH